MADCKFIHKEPSALFLIFKKWADDLSSNEAARDMLPDFKTLLEFYDRVKNNERLAPTTWQSVMMYASLISERLSRTERLARGEVR